MNTLKKKFLLAITLGLLALAPWQTAQAQAVGSTSVSIDFTNIIILHYFDSLALTFTDTGSYQENQGGGSGSAALGATISIDANITPSGGPSYASSVAVAVQNVWAVRGISASGNIQVASALTAANAVKGATGSTATASDLTVNSGGGTAAGTINVSAPGFALGNAVKGDINFNLDISAVTQSGTHSGMTYTITASAI